MNILKKGSHDNDVVTLKNRLIAFGLYRGNADDNFDTQTEQAVFEFQRCNGLMVDSVVGPQTWSRLQQGC